MRLLPAALAIALLGGLPAVTPAHAKPLNRCGWIVNPTPGNWWLTDREGDWILSTQGQDSDLPGMDLIPDLTEREFVATNGSYGYACGCMKVETSDGADGKRVVEVTGFKQLPIAQCRNDKALPKPE